jgi:hypothetical protein
MRCPRCRSQNPSGQHHHERIATFPEGLLVLGDAIHSFNPHATNSIERRRKNEDRGFGMAITPEEGRNCAQSWPPSLK